MPTSLVEVAAEVPLWGPTGAPQPQLVGFLGLQPPVRFLGLERAVLSGRLVDRENMVAVVVLAPVRQVGRYLGDTLSTGLLVGAVVAESITRQFWPQETEAQPLGMVQPLQLQPTMGRLLAGPVEPVQPVLA